VEEFRATLQTYIKLFDILTHMFNICDAVGTCLKPGHIDPHRNKLCHRIWLYFHPIHPQVLSPPRLCARVFYCAHVD